MKKYSIFLGLLFTLGLNASANRSLAIEGLWESVSDYGTTIEIFQSRNGIRVKSVYDQEWDFYRKRSRREYIDSEGRIFEMTRAGELLWREDHRDRWPVTFRRAVSNNAPNGYDDPYDYNQYGNDDYYYNDENRKELAYGNWVSRQTNKRLGISSVTFGISVQTNGSYNPYSNYKQIDQITFRNGQGDTIQILGPDQLVWKSNNGRYRFTYFRARQNFDVPQRRNCPRGW